MSNGEATTGTKNEHYDLFSIIYHALQGAQSCEKYRADAEAAGDYDLTAFFGEARDANQMIADRAKALLARRLTPTS
jgi:hypothetical protein